MVEFNPLASRQAGYNYVGNVLDDRTRRQAGRQLASGGNAAGTLAAGGMLDESLELSRQQAAQAQAQRAAQQADQDTEQQWMVQGLDALSRIPYAERKAYYQSRIRPLLQQNGFDDNELAQIDAADYTDQELAAGRAALGGTVTDPRGAAPSGYEWTSTGQRPVSGGPADPANQRWQISPFGLIPPPGWVPPEGAGPSVAPAQPATLGATLPPGWSVERPNAAPSVRSSGGAEMSQPATAGFSSTEQARSAISRAVPGVTFTSGTRSEADNTRVRGARTSNHLRGRAWDLVPPRGMTMASLAETMRSQGLRALNEGDHVHVSW